MFSTVCKTPLNGSEVERSERLRGPKVEEGNVRTTGIPYPDFDSTLLVNMAAVAIQMSSSFCSTRDFELANQRNRVTRGCTSIRYSSLVIANESTRHLLNNDLGRKPYKLHVVHIPKTWLEECCWQGVSC